MPDLEFLKNCLVGFLAMVQTMYIMIDGVDESNPRTELLQLLRNLATEPRFAKVQLLATSRTYGDIENALGPVSVSMSMSNPHVEADLRAFVEAKLQQVAAAGNWSRSLRDSVMTVLLQRSHGM